MMEAYRTYESYNIHDVNDALASEPTWVHDAMDDYLTLYIMPHTHSLLIKVSDDEVIVSDDEGREVTITKEEVA